MNGRNSGMRPPLEVIAEIGEQPLLVAPIVARLDVELEKDRVFQEALDLKASPLTHLAKRFAVAADQKFFEVPRDRARERRRLFAGQ